MTTLVKEEKYNSIVTDINNNIIEPYEKAEIEADVMTSKANAILKLVSQMNETLNEIGNIYLECKEIYDRIKL